MDKANTAFAFMNPMDEKAIDAAATRIVKYFNSKTATADVHVLLVALCEHAARHNSGDKLSNFWTRLGNVGPHAVMAGWLHAFTNLRYMKDKAGNKRWMGRDVNGKKVPIALLSWDEAKKNPFYTLEGANKAKENPPFDLTASLEKLLDRIAKADKKGEFVNKPELKLFADRFGKTVKDLQESIRKELTGEPAKAKRPAKVRKDNVVTIEQAA